MVTWREVGVNYGGQHIGKGISLLIKEVDKYAGKASAPIEQRPSTWITVIGAIGLPAAAIFLKLKDPWDKLVILTGGFISTALWDIAEEAMAAAGGGAGATYVPAAPAASVPPAPVSAATREKVY